MVRVFRLPMFVVAAALLGLIALLATLQYRWLGRISDAEREHLTATLNAQAKAFGEDVDRELTRAYLLFQVDAATDPDSVGAEMSARYDRWLATARFPRLIKDVYIVAPEQAGNSRPLERYDPSARALEPSPWPASLAPVRVEIVRSAASQHLSVPSANSTAILYRSVTPIAWPAVPALVVPSPVVIMNQDVRLPAGRGLDPPALITRDGPRYTVLLLDADYISHDMLPTLTEQHFRDAGDGVQYRVAVVPASGTYAPIYRSDPAYALAANAPSDARVDLFQVRARDFTNVANEI